MNKSKQEKKERNRKDKIWKIEIRKIFSDKCAICGRNDILHTHHIIPRQIKEFRWDVQNGICLCPKHHKYSYEISAHKNPLKFFMWLNKEYPMKLKYLMERLDEKVPDM